MILGATPSDNRYRIIREKFYLAAAGNRSRDRAFSRPIYFLVN
jgi:hypothetical protein